MTPFYGCKQHMSRVTPAGFGAVDALKDQLKPRSILSQSPSVTPSLRITHNQPTIDFEPKIIPSPLLPLSNPSIGSNQPCECSGRRHANSSDALKREHRRDPSARRMVGRYPS